MILVIVAQIDQTHAVRRSRELAWLLLGSAITINVVSRSMRLRRDSYETAAEEAQLRCILAALCNLSSFLWPPYVIGGRYIFAL